MSVLSEKCCLVCSSATAFPNCLSQVVKKSYKRLAENLRQGRKTRESNSDLSFQSSGLLSLVPNRCSGRQERACRLQPHSKG